MKLETIHFFAMEAMVFLMIAVAYKFAKDYIGWLADIWYWIYAACLMLFIIFYPKSRFISSNTKRLKELHDECRKA